MNTFDINGIPAKILYEDSKVIAFVKPFGILSQKAESDEASVLEYLNEYARGKWSAYPVHRLDRTTGGVMICAKDQRSAAALSALASGDGMKKEYLAACHGSLEGDGTLEHELYFDRRKNKSFPVKKGDRKGVKHAKLEYKPLSHHYDPERTVVHIRLHTGRTHQIRCQLAAIGHPLLGDGKYGGRGAKSICSLWSCRITLDPDALSRGQLGKSDFAKALASSPDLLTSLPEGFPWDEKHTVLSDF